MFNTDISKFIMQLVPSFLRTGGLIALLRCYCYPLMAIHQNLLAHRDKNIYTLTHNSRVCSMENVFNDRFDSTERRIYITNGFTKQRKYAYTRLENKPLYLPQYIYNRDDYADTGIDFIVWVPVAILFTPQDKIELTALINKYRLATKRFRIYRA